MLGAMWDKATSGEVFTFSGKLAGKVWDHWRGKIGGIGGGEGRDGDGDSPDRGNRGRDED